MNFENVLKDAAREMGIELKGNLHEVRLYTIQRAAHLASIAGQPGWERAMRVERNNIALMLGIQLVTVADAADNRILGIIQGALATAAGGGL